MCPASRPVGGHDTGGVDPGRHPRHVGGDRHRAGRVDERADDAETGFGLPVVQASCDYRVSARFDDVVVIKTWVEQMRRASLRFAYEARREADGLLLATGHTTHACVGHGGKPVRLPEAVVRLLTGS